MLNFLDIKFEMTIKCWQTARVNRKPKHQNALLMLHNLPPLTPSQGSDISWPMRGEHWPGLTNERPETPGECVSIPRSHKAAAQINRVSNGRSRHFRKNKMLCFLGPPSVNWGVLYYKLLHPDQEIGSPPPPPQLLNSLKKRLAIMQHRLEPSK